MVQVGDSTESPGSYLTDKASTYTRCSQVNDLLRQVVELQEAVERVCRIRCSERELNTLFNNRVPAGDITEKEEPWSWAIHRSRAMLQPLPSSFTSKEVQSSCGYRCS